MSAYSEYFLNSGVGVVHLETLEISHPSFSQTYWIVRNATNGITAKLETGAVAGFTYYPLRIEALSSQNDLDQSIRVDFGDLGELLPAEMESLRIDDSFDIKPTVIYRSYRSDDLDNVLFGPLTLEVTSFSFTHESASFEASAPHLNINETGERYTFERFPMLRGFI